MNVPIQGNSFEVAWGIPIAIYFWFTGMSAGSFMISVMATVGGQSQYKALAKIGGVLAPLLLIAGPLILVWHSAQPFRFWETIITWNPTSPMSYGAALLTTYPINCVIYLYFVFKGNQKLAKIFGIAGIPLAVAVHGYTGFILGMNIDRPVFGSPITPIYFLISAMVAGLGLLIFVTILLETLFPKMQRTDPKLLFGLGKYMAYAIGLDFLLALSEITVLMAEESEAVEAARQFLVGRFALMFWGVELFLGLLVPMLVFYIPKLGMRRSVMFASCGMVLVGNLAMRYLTVVGGQTVPLWPLS